MQYDFDVVVIGGGAAGLVASTGTAALGDRTALIEKNKLGGDCTWYGCIPSKALLKSSQVLSLCKRSSEFGLSAPADIRYDPAGVMPRVRAIVNKISTHHPPEVFEKRGLRVLFGAPQVIDNTKIELNGRIISAKRFILCTGSRPFLPPVDGLADAGYLTNETVFDIERLPKSMIVMGGGPIGVELSQAFARLGVEVTIVEMLDRLLYREDKEIGDVLVSVLEKEGIKILTERQVVSCSREGAMVAVTLKGKDDQRTVIKAEQLLVAVGRAANVEGLGLERAHVAFSVKGVRVDNTLKTSVPNIYACGDAVGPYQFSHMAEYQAIIAAGNALFPFKRHVDYASVPWCTFTDPEVAHLGLTEEGARKQFKNVKVLRSSYADNDRAVTDGEEIGFAKVICRSDGRILGAHIVGAAAGELIHEYVLVKSLRLKVTALSPALHIYPTRAQVVKRTADNYYLEMLSSPAVKGLSRFFVGLLR